ncbi:MAG: hypothetical protein ABIW79_04175 [Gemmatimonas sp.]
MLALLDNGLSTITCLASPGQAPIQLQTRRMLVVAAGVFRGLTMAGATPSDAELEAAGLITEVVARLTSRIALAPLDAQQLKHLLMRGPDGVVPAAAACRAMGVDLVVAPEAVRLVARATAARRGGLTPRTGAGLMQTVVRRALLDALDQVASSRQQLVIGPDEVLAELSRMGV